MNRIAPFAVVAAALFATGAHAQNPAQNQKSTLSNNKPQEKLSMADKMFMKNTAHGNSFEVQSGKLALRKSKDEKVRMIADMLVKEHGQSQKDLMMVGDMHDMKLPSAPNPMQKAMLRKMSKLDGMAFDKAFMKAQVDSHYATIAAFKKELTNGTDSHVRDFAAKYQPGVENHTNHITSTAARFNIPVAKPGEGRAASAVKPGKANMNGMKGMNDMGNMNGTMKSNTSAPNPSPVTQP